MKINLKYFTQKLQNLTYVSWIIVISLILWSLLLYMGIFMPQDTKQIRDFLAQADFIPHIFLLIPTIMIYKNADKENRKTLFWLLITSSGLFLNHLVFYILVYLHGSLITNNTFIIFMFDFIPHLAWISAGLFFLALILHRLLRPQNAIILLVCFIFINLIIICLFLSSIHYAFIIYSWQSISQVILICPQLFIFDCVILCLIYSNNLGLSYFLAGFTTLISGNLLIVYSVTSQTSKLLTYGELLWFLGLLLMMFGLWIIKNGSNYDIRQWFEKTNKIKNTFALWSFGTFVSGFILFFVIAYASSTLSKEIFISLPIFIMIYSIISVIFSILMGKNFEAPFKQIENNIRSLMLDNKNININDKFSTEEFVFLQKFILEAFKHKEEAKALELEKKALQATATEQEKSREIIGQMLHDIQSPLSSLGTIVEEQSSNLAENTRITLRNATNRIADIANNMLNKYENKDGVPNEITTLLVSLALTQVISEKRFEHSKKNVTFKIDFEKEANFAFIKINANDFKRMISNIINNAVDALKDKDNGEIIVKLNVTQGRAVIFIIDNGYGMPEHIRDKFYAGVAVTEGKENGHGIGLTQVNSVLQAYDGTCKINIIEGKSTRFVIKFPLVEKPYWIATEIKLNLDDTVVILDDDESIHGAWDEKFKPLESQFSTLAVKHFTYGIDAINYINSLKDKQKLNTFLLTDYELLNQGMNGLEVVKNTDMERAILVTSHASSLSMQEMVIQAGIKTLPKELVPAVTISVDKKLEKWSKKVDMVWVEDKKEFVDDMIRNFYSHLKIDVYYEPDTFLADIHQYPLETRFILDTYYVAPDNTPYLLDGFEIAKKIYDIGYRNLILFSGENVAEERKPDYLTVVLKNDLVNKKLLDKL